MLGSIKPVLKREISIRRYSSDDLENLFVSFAKFADFLCVS